MREYLCPPEPWVAASTLPRCHEWRHFVSHASGALDEAARTGRSRVGHDSGLTAFQQMVLILAVHNCFPTGAKSQCQWMPRKAEMPHGLLDLLVKRKCKQIL